VRSMAFNEDKTNC